MLTVMKNFMEKDMSWSDAVKAQIAKLREAVTSLPRKSAALKAAERFHDGAREDKTVLMEKMDAANAVALKRNATAPTPEMKALEAPLREADERVRAAFTELAAAREKYGPDFLKVMGDHKEESEALLIELLEHAHEVAEIWKAAHVYAMNNRLPSFRVWSHSARISQLAREGLWLIKNKNIG